MATTAFSAKRFARGINVTTWAAVPNGNQGAAQSAPGYNDKCVHVIGTFGAAGSVAMEGSNDNVNWAPLHDTAGNAIAITAFGLKQILENPIYIRPNVTAGDGTTALTVIMAQRSGLI